MVLAVDELRAQHQVGNRQIVDRPNLGERVFVLRQGRLF
jgi:hypothetical protein